MLGRARELAAARDVLDRAREGTSGALLLHGEAGVGKTALLDALAAEARATGVTVLRASGVQSEQNVAWSGLSELLRPVTARIADLPAVQGVPLASALALGPPVEADRFAIGIGTLGLLAAAAADAPVLAVVDDVQWLDRPSAQAVLFAGRRLAAEGVALVLARRDGGADDDALDLGWVDAVAVGPLPADVATELLRSRAPGPVAPEVARRLVEAAAGNALAVVTLPSLLTPDQLVGREPLPDPLPAPASFERQLAQRLAGLPDRARRALTVAAAHAGSDLAPVAAALGAVGLDVADLRPAEDLGVVALADGAVSFSHPLVRSAAYHATSPAGRRDAHRALAAAFAAADAVEAMARHLVSAAVAPDEDVARSLDEAAGQARSRGALSAAADLAAHAARLSPAPADRDRRRVAAAELALLAGAMTTAKALLDEVGSPDDPAVAVDAARVRGRWEVLAGSNRRGIASLVEAAEGSAAADPAGAALLLAHAATAALSSGRHADAAALADRALDLAGDDGRVAALADLARRAARVAAGRVEDGAVLVALHERLVDHDDLLRAAQPALLAAVSALVWLEDFERAEQVADAAVATARRLGALDLLTAALANRGWVQFRIPRVQPAIASATEALELASSTGQTSVVLLAKNLLAHLYGHAGRFEESRALATEVLAHTDPARLTPLRYNAVLAVANAELATGRPDVAVDLLEGIVDAASPTPYFRNPAAYGGAFQLVEAYLRVGRVDDARALLDATEDVVVALDQPWPKGQVARLRGWLEDDYDDWFAEAVALVAHVAAATVVTRVDWAARLAADGRADAARRQLRAALALARRTGYHGRTSAIVQASASLGERVVATPDELARLSGQELAVAAAVAAGASVPQAAAELFLSPQTVERELAEACRKLGVSDAAGLAARLDGPSSAHDADGAPGWRLSVLGGCEVERGGVVLAMPTGRAGALVRMLGAHGGRLTVDEVVEHLWPGADLDTGRVRLRNVLARVRRSLGPCVHRRLESVVLDDAVQIDAARFFAAADAALRAGDPARAEAALALHGGELLPDDRYEPWADEPRARARARQLQLLDLLAADAWEAGRWDVAARHLERAVEVDPDEHDRYVAAAEARLRQGRRSAALAWCRRAQAAAAELGVPAPERLAAVERAASAPGGRPAQRSTRVPTSARTR